jgi:hypothetical protein
MLSGYVHTGALDGRSPFDALVLKDAPRRPEDDFTQRLLLIRPG